jgi:site-specific DNA-methyltransferase (adenine-specific)
VSADLADYIGKVTCGDSLVLLPALPADSIDTVVTDPPYELGFMGKSWDQRGVSFDPATWAAVLRVAKPGAFLLAFGGTRTWHRIAVAIEDAGWEIRDTICWLYGSGFPKSLDISKAMDKAAGAEREVIEALSGPVPGDHGGSGHYGHGEDRSITAPATDLAREWDGWGTALKPAHEPIIVAMKPLDGTFAANAEKWGVAGLNIDGGRIPGGWVRKGGEASTPYGSERTWNTSSTPDIDRSASGRFPANVILDEEAARLLDEQSGGKSFNPQGIFATDQKVHREIYNSGDHGNRDVFGYGDSGGASRFFKTCEADPEGLLFHRAKSILEAWNPDLANTADSSSSLSSQHVASVLSDAVTLVSRGATRLSGLTGLSTTATPTELRKLCETAIAMILSSEEPPSPEPPPLRHFPNGSLARFAETPSRTGTTTITISHWQSDGFVAPATFSIMPANTEAGEPDSPSRFRYCAKASRAEREAGLDCIDAKPPPFGAEVGDGLGRGISNTRQNVPVRNGHPTVKPLALMCYLVKLTATPPGGIVLDPFAGSGTTGAACVAEGRDFIGLELDPSYTDIANARIAEARRNVLPKLEIEA